ncbi:MAG: hypothetical protein QM725_09645 [Lacibacter sp.]
MSKPNNFFSEFTNSLIAPVVFAAIVGGIFSVVSTCNSNRYNKTIQQISTNQKYVELAVSIIRDSSTMQNRPLREWAGRLISVCAPDNAKLSDSAIHDLIITPVKFTPLWSGDNKIYSIHTICPEGFELDSNGWDCVPVKSK